MGKKKEVKKAELSVEVTESSSIGTEQQQNTTPRKRGRPRKIVEKTESDEEKEIKRLKEDGTKEGAKEGETSSSLKEPKSEETEEPKPRSRARRKSKPRKST